jgi:hypothetical protein
VFLWSKKNITGDERPARENRATVPPLIKPRRNSEAITSVASPTETIQPAARFTYRMVNNPAIRT